MADRAGHQVPPATFVVVVTHDRSDYLSQLLESVRGMSALPEALVVVDNASTDDTQAVVTSFSASMPEGFVINQRLDTNVGGSGGFSAGVEEAIRRGAHWLWLMDDDVTVLPDALERLGPWCARFKCLHGRRYDHEGKPFFWQTRINSFLGIFYPRPGDVFEERDYFVTNSGTFEGMMIHRDIVAEIGLPDPRFFLTWDDAVYGWLAARITPVAYVNEFVLRRMRPQRSISLGIRHLNDSSDVSRFYVMRNRGLVARYLAAGEHFHPVGFAMGTLLTAGKELVRAVAVERRPSGVLPLVKGWRASRGFFADDDWRPMPPYRLV